LRTVFGAYASRSKFRMLAAIVLVILVVDGLTKLAANLVLEPDSVVSLGKFVVLSLTFNDTALGGPQRAVIDEVGHDEALGQLVAVPLICTLLLPLVRAEHSVARKVVTFVLADVLIEGAAPILGAHLSIPPDSRSWVTLRVFAVVPAWALLLRACRAILPYVLIAATVGAGVSNALNLMVDRRGVTDFILVRVLEPSQGSANAADIIIDAAVCALVAWATASVALSAVTLVPTLSRGLLGRTRAWLARPLRADIQPRVP